MYYTKFSRCVLRPKVIVQKVKPLNNRRSREHAGVSYSFPHNGSSFEWSPINLVCRHLSSIGISPIPIIFHQISPCFYVLYPLGVVVVVVVIIPSELGHIAVSTISLTRGKTVGWSEFRTRDFSIPSSALCQSAALGSNGQCGRSELSGQTKCYIRKFVAICAFSRTRICNHPVTTRLFVWSHSQRCVPEI